MKQRIQYVYQFFPTVILLLLSFTKDSKNVTSSKYIYDIVGLSSCEAGDLYDEYDRENNIEGWWYLNVQLPATCSGRVTEYKVEYYDPQNGNGLYRATVAMWAPVNSAAVDLHMYEQVCCTAISRTEVIILFCIG